MSGGSFYLKPDGNRDTSTGAGGSIIGYDQITSVSSSTSNASVADAHVQVVLSGATTVSTTVADGGEQAVFGAASATVLNGTEVVYGKDSGANIGAGGLQYIYSGGTATSATISGANSDQDAYGIASNTTVLSGGFLFVGSGGSGVNSVIGSGGSEYVASGGTAIATTISGSGVLEIADGNALSGPVTFAGTGGTLLIDDTTMPTGVISGFAPGDSIVFTGLGQVAIPPGFSTSVTLLPGNVLQLDTQDIFFHTATYDLQLDPSKNFGGEQFELGIGTDVFGFLGSLEITLSGQPGPIVSSGTTYVSGAVTSTGVTVTGSGTLAVLSGGTALDTTLDSGGSEIVSASGSDGGAQIEGGTQFDFGLASGATVFTGSQVVESGGTASGTILSGGTEIVSAGGTDDGAKISGGTQFVDFGRHR